MSGPLHIELILKPYVQLKGGQCMHSLLLLSSPIREISSSIKKILPLDKLINQQEGILAYKVINGTYLLNDFLNHGDVNPRHQIQLEILVTWGYHYMQQLNLNSLFAIEPSIRGMAYQVTCAAHHHSVFLRINYDSCICLSHSFQIYVVSMIVKLLSSSTEVTMQYS